MDNYKCPSFLPRETRLSPQLVVTGGGGKAKSGVKNFITIGGLKRLDSGDLTMVKLLEEDTGEDLIHQVFPSSNGRFLFCSLRNGTVIYRVLDNNVEGKEHIEEKDQSVHKDPTSASPLRLERVLYMKTGEKEQNVIVSKKDDVTLFTGGDEGDLCCWEFELIKDDSARSCKLTEKHRIHLFDCAINTITFNATESYCLAGSEKGQIAIIDLKTFGIVQRVESPVGRKQVKKIAFFSSTCMVVMYAGGGDSALVLYQPMKCKEGDGNGVKWVERKQLVMKDRMVCAMTIQEPLSLALLGDCEGEIGAIAIPSLTYYMKFTARHSFVVTSMTCIPTNPSLLTLQDRDKQCTEDHGWIVSCSADTSLSATAVKKTANSNIITFPFLLLLIIIILIFYALSSRSQ